MTYIQDIKYTAALIEHFMDFMVIFNVNKNYDNDTWIIEDVNGKKHVILTTTRLLAIFDKWLVNKLRGKE